MDAKSFLRQIRRIDILLNAKQKELEVLRCKALYPGISYEEKVQSSFGNSKENQLINLIEYEIELNKSIDEFIGIKKEVSSVIDKLEDGDQIDILYKRYFQYMTWEEIATSKSYTYQWIHKIHAKALIEVQNILDKGQKLKQLIKVDRN